jgi:DNA invertase Pin-like site-specific DNA recombinase
MKAAIYARVSTTDQTCENQRLELRRYAEARGWTVTREYVDEGVSVAKERRPALDALVKDAKRRRVDVVVCWRLDRLGRNLRHLVTLLDELHGLGIAFVSLGEGIDCTTPAGKLQLHILAALAEFERERIRERVVAGLARVKSNGQRLGRPEKSSQKPFSRLCGVSPCVRLLDGSVCHPRLHIAGCLRKPAWNRPSRPAENRHVPGALLGVPASRLSDVCRDGP